MGSREWLIALATIGCGGEARQRPVSEPENRELAAGERCDAFFRDDSNPCEQGSACVETDFGAFCATRCERRDEDAGDEGWTPCPPGFRCVMGRVRVVGSPAFDVLGDTGESSILRFPYCIPHDG